MSANLMSTYMKFSDSLAKSVAFSNSKRKEYATKFGNAVRKAREAKGIDQSRLSELSGVSHAYISMVENGTRLPSFEFAERICKHLS